MMIGGHEWGTHEGAAAASSDDDVVERDVNVVMLTVVLC